MPTTVALNLPELRAEKSLGRDGIVERAAVSYRERPAFAVWLIESAARVRSVTEKFLETASDLAALSAQLRYEVPAAPHARVAEVLFHGRDSRGQAGLVIALPQGGRLLDARDAGRWSARRALHLVAQLVETLGIARARRLHGGSFSPSSLFLSGAPGSGARAASTELTLLNLGLVQIEAAYYRATGQHTPGLTDAERAYRAPELCTDPAQVGEPAEVFSLARLLQFLILGEPGSDAAPGSVHAQVRGLLAAMSSAQPAERPALQQVHQQLAQILSGLSDFELLETLWDKDGVSLHRALKVSTQQLGWLRVLPPAYPPALRPQLESVAQVLQESPQPGVATPHELGEQPDGSPYLFSELVGTQTLRAHVEKHGPLGRSALGVIESLARTVRSLHRLGVLHLGLCPDSVLIQSVPAAADGAEPGPTLRCFLLQTEHGRCVRRASAARTLAEDTPEPPPARLQPYLSPEQFDHHSAIGERADIYALGSLLCFLLTGQEPPLRSVELANDSGVDKLLHNILVKLLNRLRARRAIDRPTPDEAVRTLTWLARLDELMHGHLLDGKYRIERPLAQGGMNALFVVSDVHLNRPAVLKCPFPDLAIAIERARQEAEAATQARRGNSAVVHVLQYGELDTDVPYLLMEMVDGEVLTDRLRRSGAALPEHEVLQIGLAIAEIMDEVHGNGVIHRDLKPDNIMLEKDRSAALGVRVRILDFGIARLAAEQYAERRRLTGVGSFMGTPDYMAPEQGFDAAHVTATADVYSLGVILYSLLGGQLPPVHPLPSVGSPQLMALLGQMLRFVPDIRPSMSEVAVRLRALTQPRPQPRSGLWLGAAALCVGVGLTAYSAARPAVISRPPLRLSAPPPDAGARPLAPPIPGAPGVPDVRGAALDRGLPSAQPDLGHPLELRPAEPAPGHIEEPDHDRPVEPSGGHGTVVAHGPNNPSQKRQCAARISDKCIKGGGLTDAQKAIFAAKANQVGLQLCGRQSLVLTKLNWYVPEPDSSDARQLVARLDAYWTVKSLDRTTLPRTVVISCP